MRSWTVGGVAKPTLLTYAVVATFVLLSPADWVVAVVPDGSAVVEPMDVEPVNAARFPFVGEPVVVTVPPPATQCGFADAP